MLTVFCLDVYFLQIQMYCYKDNRTIQTDIILCVFCYKQCSLYRKMFQIKILDLMGSVCKCYFI
jgi:hypothetical protein